MMAAFRAPPPLAAPGLPSYASHMLLLPSHAPGANMSIAQFCAEYELDNSICSKLDDNGFKVSHILQYVVMDELKEMGFKFREVAVLKDAVGRWSVPVVP
jgi:hypothetical protein